MDAIAKKLFTPKELGGYLYMGAPVREDAGMVPFARTRQDVMDQLKDAYSVAPGGWNPAELPPRARYLLQKVLGEYKPTEISPEERARIERMQAAAARRGGR
jgi:hypothetical protein